MNKQLKARILLIIVAFLWGMGFLGVQGALDAGWQPFALLFARGLIGGLALLAVAVVNKTANFSKPVLARCVLAGFIMWLGFATQTYGQQYANVSTASILTGLYVLFTPFMAGFLKKQRLPTQTYLACVIAFVAVILVSYSGSKPSFELGELLLLMCAIVYSLHFLLLEDLAGYKSALAISGLQLLVMSACSLIMMLATKQYPQVSGLQYVLFLGLFCSGAAFSLQVYAQQQVNSSVASVLISFECVFGVLGAIIVYQEAISWQVVGGCIAMMLAIYVLEMGAKH